MIFIKIPLEKKVNSHCKNRLKKKKLCGNIILLKYQKLKFKVIALLVPCPKIGCSSALSVFSLSVL